MKANKWQHLLIMGLALSGLLLPFTPAPVYAENTGTLKPLNSVPVPLPPNLNVYVKDIPAAIQLGKALFWDMQVGGDGFQACATCHFQAGEDVRATNSINPRGNGEFTTIPAGATLVPTLFPLDNGDVVGSQGIIDGNFLGLRGTPFDLFELVPDPLFNVGGVNVRQVTGRNAPSAINAIFNFRNFWDGRASNFFNGVSPFGKTDFNAFVYKVVNGKPAWVKIAIPNASAASQAVGPPGSAVEMTYAGRSWQQLGRKMLRLRPLAQQTVHPNDSVLGPLASPPKGLKTTYTALIQKAFQPAWWNYSRTVADGFNMMESNFSLYFGLSVMLYESTLVSDQAPLSQYLAGNTNALTARQKLGMDVYVGKGRCDKCHTGAELTQAAVSQVHKETDGFLNTGVRPVAEDGGDILQPGLGMFKTSGLWNIELNGPYFHNGDKATLRQVVDFYDRGGDFPVEGLIDEDVRPLGLTEDEKVALVDFMLSMTDERVRTEKAPFDHPSLNVPNGPNLPAVGRLGGNAVSRFLNLDPYQP